MIDVPFFSLLFNLGISVNGLAFALFKSKISSDGFSSPFCCRRSVEVFIVLNELDLHVQLARCLLNLRREKQILHKCKDPRVGVFPHRQWLRLTLGVLRRKPWTLASRLVPHCRSERRDSYDPWARYRCHPHSDCSSADSVLALAQGVGLVDSAAAVPCVFYFVLRLRRVFPVLRS